MRSKIIAIVIFIILSLSLNVIGQTRVKVDSKGNYSAVAKQSANSTSKAIKTDKTYTDSKGKKYEVWQSVRGKLFIIRTSAKGNEYKQYLSIN